MYSLYIYILSLYLNYLYIIYYIIVYFYNKLFNFYSFIIIYFFYISSILYIFIKKDILKQLQMFNLVLIFTATAKSQHTN